MNGVTYRQMVDEDHAQVTPLSGEEIQEKVDMLDVALETPVD